MVRQACNVEGLASCKIFVDHSGRCHPPLIQYCTISWFSLSCELNLSSLGFAIEEMFKTLVTVTFVCGVVLCAVASSSSTSNRTMILATSCNGSEPCITHGHIACGTEWYEEDVCYHYVPVLGFAQRFSSKSGMVGVKTYNNHAACEEGGTEARVVPNTCTANPIGSTNVSYVVFNPPTGSTPVPVGASIILDQCIEDNCAPSSIVFKHTFHSGRCQQNWIPSGSGMYVWMEAFTGHGFNAIRYSTHTTANCTGGYLQRRMVQTGRVLSGDEGEYYLKWTVAQA